MTKDISMPLTLTILAINFDKAEVKQYHRLIININQQKNSRMTDRRFINHQNLNEKGQLLDVQCRFCHYPEKYNKYTYIAPCSCYGARRYVHKTCIQQWIIVKFEHVYNQPDSDDPQQFNVFCEVCQQRIEIEFIITNKCSKYSDLVEAINEKRVLFALLLLMAVCAIVAIIIITIFSYQNGSFPTLNIIGASVSIGVIFIVLTIFVCKFMMIKSIQIDHIANNKQQPKIMAFQEPNIDEILQQELENDPYFGYQQSRRQKKIDQSLMLESRRQSKDDAGSVESKTLTDYVMKKMYKHDQISQQDIDRKSSNIYSKYSKKQIPQTKDQEVQMSDLSRYDKSIQKNVNVLDREVQPSMKSVQLHNVSIQHSLIPRTNQISQSVVPSQNMAKKNRSHSKNQQLPGYIQRQIPAEKEYNHFSKQNEVKSNGQQKNSDEQLVKPPLKFEKQSKSKLKLRNSKDPIKIKIHF